VSARKNPPHPCTECGALIYRANKKRCVPCAWDEAQRLRRESSKRYYERKKSFRPQERRDNSNQETGQ
jgi:ribosomal protein L37E